MHRPERNQRAPRDRVVTVLRDPADVNAAIQRWAAKGWQHVRTTNDPEFPQAVRLHLQRHPKKK